MNQITGDKEAESERPSHNESEVHLSERPRCWTPQPASLLGPACRRSRLSGRRCAPRSRRAPAGPRRFRRRRTRVPALQTHRHTEPGELSTGNRRLTEEEGRTGADQGVVPAARHQLDLLRLQSWETRGRLFPANRGKVLGDSGRYLSHRWVYAPSAWSPDPAGPSCCCQTWRASCFLGRWAEGLS